MKTVTWGIKMWKIDFLKLGGLDFSNQIVEWNFLGNKFYHVSISFFFSPPGISEAMIESLNGPAPKNSLPIAIPSYALCMIERLINASLDMNRMFICNQ